MLFYIFRHGQTDGNVQNIVQGAGVDITLNETGKEQAAVLGKTLAALNLPVIYSSRMRRAEETAQIVASFTQAEVKTIPGLEEVHFGEAEGMYAAEALKKYASSFRAVIDDEKYENHDAAIPGGESINQSIERALKALDEIKKDNKLPKAAVATHGSLMHNLYRHFFGLRRSFPNCDYFVVDL